MGGTRRVTGPLPRATPHRRHQQTWTAHRDPGPHALVPAQRTGAHDATSPGTHDTAAALIERSGRHQRIVIPPRRARHRENVPPTLVVAALGALVGACVFAAVGRALVDDAYLTLSYARTLGLHGDWGVHPGLTANTATSPLTVLLTGGVTTLTRDAFAATGVVLTVTFAALGAALTRIGARLGLPAHRAPAFGLALLATSPLLLSTIGLESFLALALTTGLAERVLAGRRWTAGVLAGLLVLTRPDLVVVGLVAVAVAGRGRWRVALAAVATASPWFAWSWWVLGSAVPDTLLVGTGADRGPWDYASGPLLWWERFPVATTLVVLPVVAGLVALPFWLRRPDLRPVGAVLGLGAIAHAGAMSLLGVAPSHWLYAPAAGGLGLLAALTCARARTVPVRVVAGSGAAALAVTCVLTAAGSVLPPMTSNWASTAQYVRIADRLPTGATIESPGEVGTLAYYCGCRVVDGLADRGSLSPAIESRLASATGPGGWLLRLNHARFRPVAPVPRDYRITTRVVREPTAPMGTRWGPWRTWDLEAVPPGR
ncbi:MAG: glycosyltransferase family 87 protein [Pseudonocardia sediminis]